MSEGSAKPKGLSGCDDVLSPSEAKRVRRGMAQIKAGQFKLRRDVKHVLNGLVAESRRKEKSITYEQYRADRLKRSHQS